MKIGKLHFSPSVKRVNITVALTFIGTLSRASFQKFKISKTHLTATKTYKYWSSFDKNYNVSVMKLKKSAIIVVPPRAQDPNLEKSA